MTTYYKLESYRFIPIITKLTENTPFTQYPVNKHGITKIKHYFNIPFCTIETDQNVYYYIHNIDNLNQIVKSIKRNIINNIIIDSQNTIDKITMERRNYMCNNTDYTNNDEYLLIEKRLYYANINGNDARNLLLSSIFIETSIPDHIHEVLHSTLLNNNT